MALALCALVAASPNALDAQRARPVDPLDSLLAAARNNNPEIAAAQHRVDAARKRIGPAGALPDPMLQLGLMNMPILQPGLREEMTMNTIMLSQTLPASGRLGRERRIAEFESAAAEAALAAARLRVRTTVARAYYDIAYTERALDVLDKSRSVLSAISRSAEARYAAGIGEQRDVLRARVEETRVAEQAVELVEKRRALAAELTAALGHTDTLLIEGARVSARIAALAVAPADRITFVSQTIGARASDSPLPPLAELQERAMRSNPELAEHEAMIAAARVRADIAQRAHIPDLDISVQYGARVGNPDMISIMVAAPLPLRRGARQNALAAAQKSEVLALEAEHHTQLNTLTAEVARLVADIERTRSQLALYVKAILPQGRAALESGTGNFAAGRGDIESVLENRNMLFEYELAYQRLLSDFAVLMAELERATGTEVIS